MAATTTFTTAFIKIYNGSSQYSIEKRIEYFESICQTGVFIALFTSPEYIQAMSYLLIKYSNIRLINIVDITNTKMHSLMVEYKDKLPDCRNLAKDTFEFLTLMNCKTEFRI